MYIKYVGFLCCFFTLNAQLPVYFIRNSEKKVHAVAVDLRSRHAMNDWDFFHAVVFMPSKVFAARDQGLPIYILVPQDLEGKTPIAHEAPFIEGVRTFLAQARVHYLMKSEQSPVFCVFCVEEQLNMSFGSIWKLIEQKVAKCVDFSDLMRGLHSNVCNTRTWSEGYQDSSEKMVLVCTLKDKPMAKRWCVSGGSGFIGQVLVRKLLERGHQVLVLDNYSCSSRENLSDIVSLDLQIIEHDVSQSFTIMGHIDGVIHLASIPSPVDYYAMPLQTLRSGLEGTRHMLMLAHEKGARFLFSSTSEVYGDPDVDMQSEDYPGRVDYLGPRSQYDQSKRGAETLIKLYYERYGLDVRIARIFNTYGPGMRLHDGRVVTNFIAAALEGTPITMYGQGNQTRSFGYVDDTVDGLLRLLEADSSAWHSIVDRVFNVGTPDEFTIAELAHKIGDLTKLYLHKEPKIVCVPNPDQTDPKQRRPDIRKAERILGFHPKVNLDQGLKKTFLHFAVLKVCA